MAIVILLLAGWGASPAPVAAAAVALYPIGDVTTWPDTPFRWKDIADNVYSAAYRDSYDYGQATVTLSFSESDPLTFRGHLVGSGLKPNFAYQMKLVGKPTATSQGNQVWGALGDDWSNQQLGFLGRWWRAHPDPGNSNDADYLAHHDDPSVDYLFEGYLLFDYLVTDQYGNADKTFALDSSYHVLWNTLLNTRVPQPNDSPITYHLVAGSAAQPEYDTDVGPTTVGLYAEWEPTRPVPGTAALPQGEYNVRSILTEESFHQTGIGGYWAGAMGSDDVRFTLADDSLSLEAQGGQWHLITFPCQPADPDPWMVLNELRPPSASTDLLSGCLHRYDHNLQRYETYYHWAPTPFGDITPGDGYWLWVHDDITICYRATPPGDPPTVYFPSAGWYLVGSPQADDVPLDMCIVCHVGESRSFGDAANVWIMDPLLWYDPGSHAYASCGVSPLDSDHHLRAFRGYWLHTFVDDVTLMTPAVGCRGLGEEITPAEYDAGVRCCAGSEMVETSRFFYPCDTPGQPPCDEDGCMIPPPTSDTDPWWQCTPCGNGVCEAEYGENRCNCSADCGP